MDQVFDPTVEDHSDMYVGCSDGYGWDQIKFLVNSLDQSGFTGRKVMLILSADRATVEMLAAKDWKIAHFGTVDANGNYAKQGAPVPVHVLRFFYLSRFLEALPESQKPEYVITTDVRDVVFQKNPFAALRDYARAHPELGLIAPSESLRYRDEPWGNQNLLETFGPFIHEKYKNCEMYNVGVLAGTRQGIQEISQMIFEMSNGRRIKIVDQAVFNFIVNQKTFSSNILKLPSEAGWAAQLGTTADPAKLPTFGPLLMEPSPLVRDGKVYTSNGATEFSIVHQYDRIAELRKSIEAQFGDG